MQASTAHLERENTKHILAIWGLLAAFLVLACALLSTTLSDSAATDLTFAINWLHEGLPAFNTGQPHLGFDNPLAILALTALSAILPDMWTPIALNMLVMAGIAQLTWHLSDKLFPGLESSLSKLIFMLLLPLNPLLLQQAGMGETDSLAILCFLFYLKYYLNGRPYLAGLSLGLMGLAWFESLIITPLLFWILFRQKRFLFWHTLLPFLGVLAIWFIYAYRQFGSPFPHGVFSDILTFRLDSESEASLRTSNILQALFGVTIGPAILRIGATIGGIGLALYGWIKWRHHLGVWLCIGVGALYFGYFSLVRTDVFIGTPSFPRFLMYAPIALGLITLLHSARLHFTPKVAGFMWGGVLFVWAALLSGIMLQTWALQRYYEAGVRKQVALELTSYPSEVPLDEKTVLARHVGQLGLHTPLTIYDWFGITTPLALPLEEGTYLPSRLIAHHKPTYVVLRDLDVLNMLGAGYDIKQDYRLLKLFEMPDEAPSFIKDNPPYALFERR